MSIINDQNILGNPELALATRAGGSVTIADYSFATASNLYEKNLHEAMGNARGGSWTQPSSYAGEVAQAEVEKEPATPDTGIAGEPTQSIAEPTKYGAGDLGESAEADPAVPTTKLGQVAAVIADKVEATESVVDPGGHAVKSAIIVEEGISGPVASGGAYNGYVSTNPYYISTVAFQGAGATTIPDLINTTNWQGDMADTTARTESLGDDAPTPVGSYADAAAAQNAGSKSVGAYTQGQSAADIPSSNTSFMSSYAAAAAAQNAGSGSSGGGYTQGPSTKTVFTTSFMSSYAAAAAAQNLGGNGPQQSSNGMPPEAL